MGLLKSTVSKILCCNGGSVLRWSQRWSTLPTFHAWRDFIRLLSFKLHLYFRGFSVELRSDNRIDEGPELFLQSPIQVRMDRSPITVTFLPQNEMYVKSIERSKSVGEISHLLRYKLHSSGFLPVPRCRWRVGALGASATASCYLPPSSCRGSFGLIGLFSLGMIRYTTVHRTYSTPYSAKM